MDSLVTLSTPQGSVWMNTPQQEYSTQADPVPPLSNSYEGGPPKMELSSGG